MSQYISFDDNPSQSEWRDLDSELRIKSNHAVELPIRDLFVFDNNIWPNSSYLLYKRSSKCE